MGVQAGSLPGWNVRKPGKGQRVRRHLSTPVPSVCALGSSTPTFPWLSSLSQPALLAPGGDAESHLPVSSCPVTWRVQNTTFSWGDASWSCSVEWEISYGPSALPPNGCGEGPALGTGPDGLTLRNRGCHYTSGGTGNSRGPRALRQPPTRKAEACEVLGVSQACSSQTAHPTPWDPV